LYNSCYKKFDKIFAVSQVTRKHFIDKFSACRNIVDVYYNPINIQHILQLSQEPMSIEMNDEQVEKMHLIPAHSIDEALEKAKALLNKTDLPVAADREKINSAFAHVAELSASTGEGRDELEKAVKKIFSTDEFNPNAACLTSERQRQCSVNAMAHIDEAIAALQMGVTLDAVNVCADCAIDALLELTGEKATSAVVDEVFKQFCVGK
jgi:tRNA U34 5-carboxymethylaminomethyl modifying GTPase MnmE/TrmE